MDRFLICISMGYPALEDEVALLKRRHTERPLDTVVSVANGQELQQMQRESEKTYIHDSVYRYMVALADATRKHPFLELGLSPRGTLALGRMARAYAFLSEREYVVPKDVQKALTDVGVHRIRLNQKARLNGKTAETILKEILNQVPEPKPGEKYK